MMDVRAFVGARRRTQPLLIPALQPSGPRREPDPGPVHRGAAAARACLTMPLLVPALNGRWKHAADTGPGVARAGSGRTRPEC